MTMLLRLRDTMKAKLKSASAPPNRIIRRKEANLLWMGRSEEPELRGRVISIAGLFRETGPTRTSLNGAMKLADCRAGASALAST
jgi:hypothetical protein